ncbi:hypothetical protein NDU88_000555 [Pleurodeles waltl]|uniref:Uncharacterized protein n=1 Tax=Pleurodeles waltl TaxID=8319 RepID=A0AAV7U5B6_PLEWA|nr:hypothetical protein NDU88_000555 [Pleurodeles waltl]
MAFGKETALEHGKKERKPIAEEEEILLETDSLADAKQAPRTLSKTEAEISAIELKKKTGNMSEDIESFCKEKEALTGLLPENPERQ